MFSKPHRIWQSKLMTNACKSESLFKNSNVCIPWKLDWFIIHIWYEYIYLVIVYIQYKYIFHVYRVQSAPYACQLPLQSRNGSEIQQHLFGCKSKIHRKLDLLLILMKFQTKIEHRLNYYLLFIQQLNDLTTYHSNIFHSVALMKSKINGFVFIEWLCYTDDEAPIRIFSENAGWTQHASVNIIEWNIVSGRSFMLFKTINQISLLLVFL